MNATPHGAGIATPQPDLFAALVRHWPEALLVLDCTLALVASNDRARSWLPESITRAARTGEACRPLAAAEFPWQITAQQIAEALAGRSVELAPTLIVGRDCAPRHLSATLAALTDADAVVALTVSLQPSAAPVARDAIARDVPVFDQTELLAALEAADRAVWVWEIGACRSSGTDAFFRMFGLPPKSVSLAPEFWWQRVHPEDAAHLRQPLVELMDGKRFSADLEFRMRHEDGRWLWLQLTASELGRSASGAPAFLIGLVRDVTSEHEAADSLRASEERFRLASLAVQGVLYEFDGATCRLERYGLERTLGYRDGEIAPTIEAWIALIHPEERARANEQFNRYDARFNMPVFAEYRVLHRDGSYRHMWDHYVRRRDAAGSVRVVGCSVDVTDRISTARALSRSELLMRALMAVSQSIVFEVRRLEGDTFYTTVANQARFAQILGWTREEYERAGGWNALVHPDDDQASLMRRERAFRGQPANAQLRVRRRDGSWCWLSIDSHPMRDDAGRVTSVVGAAQDITARKLAEIALLESRAMFESMAANSADWILYFDAAGRCVFLNRGLHGRARDECIGMHFRDLSPKDIDRDELAAKFDEVLIGGAPHDIVQHTRFDGEVLRSFDLRMRPVRADRQIVGVVVNVNETTELRRRERMLHTQATILRTMREGVVLLDMNGRIGVTNPAFDAMFGYPSGALVGRPISLLFDPVRARESRVGRGLYDTIEQPFAQPVEFECTRRDGSVFVASGVFTPLSIDGADYWLAVLNDVTERKRLEHEILEVASREQQRIGSDLHDGLGQDLTGIALMLRGVVARLRREHREIGRDVEEVIVLVNAAIESTRMLARGLSPVSVGSGGLPAALAALADRAAERFGISARFIHNEARPAAIDEFTATHLYRIAQEATTNAIRHGGVSDVCIELDTDGARLRLTIADDGRGLRLPIEGSAGMGLKIMRYRAQMVNGELTLENSPDGGFVVQCVCMDATLRADPQRSTKPARVGAPQGTRSGSNSS